MWRAIIEEHQMIKILWFVTALIFGFMSVYSTYYLNPESAIVYVLGLIVLSFPTGLMVAAIVPLILKIFGVHFDMAEDIFLNLLIISAGYYQWFFLVPLIRKKNK